MSEIREHLFPNAERCLKSTAQMIDLFADAPELVERTRAIADRCKFSLDELRYEYPDELCPNGSTPIAHLSKLTWAGAAKRYPNGLPDKVRRLVEHELRLIEELHYEGYFLTVWDLVRFARSQNILCQGRGSAANSAVCFCLGVTSVDPERIDVLFERFVSKERNEAPDIDVDFEHERREEVLQYIYEKYGRDRAAMTAVVITYRPRSAIRDVGKALGISPDGINSLAESIEHYREQAKLEKRFSEAGFDATSKVGRQLKALVNQILGFPRHLSQHVGGMVITQGLLSEMVPIENAAMPDRTVIQWDKDDLDSLGILKVDCLSLGMLTAIHKCFDLVKKHYERPLTLATVPAEDPNVYDMICAADTMGVFQIESRAQMSMLPRLRPRVFYDLVIEVAIVRPGPIQGDMVHPYLRRRSGQEDVSFPNEEVRSVLHKTLGVPIFQEQAMRLAIVAAGFTPGEADQLRRAMGAWRRPGVIDQFHRKLIDGMRSRGYDTDFADRVFKQIRGFGEYGFPESHAASFALLVYVSAWLKHHYPTAFTVSILNSLPMGFYAPAQLLADLKKHGRNVVAADVNFSEWNSTLEVDDGKTTADGRDAALDRWRARLGFRLVSGLKRDVAEAIVSERQARGAFESFDDFCRRTRFSKATLNRLSLADAFASIGLSRRRAMWQSLPIQRSLPLFDDLPSEAAPSELPQMTPIEEVVADYQSSGLSLKNHPIRFLRSELEKRSVISNATLAALDADSRVRVSGLVLMRQRPSTASGITFVTLEDETGFANLIVRPNVWERFHRAARTATVLLARGTLQREGDIIHVLADKLEDLSALLSNVDSQSRDFR